MITMIACVDNNMGIGKDNKLLVYIPQDLKHFKETTLHKVCVFGRSTFESLPVKPLPDRHSVILTRDKEFSYNGCLIANSVEEVLEMAKGMDVFICGGEHVYRQFMPYADELIITHVKEAFDADAFFPDIDKSIWAYDYWSPYCKPNSEETAFEIVKYRRKSNNPERGKSMTVKTSTIKTQGIKVGDIDIKGKTIGELVMEHGETLVVEAVPQKTRGFELVAFNHRKNHKSSPDNHYKNPIAIVVDGKRELRYAPSIQKPRRAEDGACASDVFSPVNTVIMPDEQVLIWTDVKAYMQKGEVLLANVRSSQGKVRIQLANTQGWIDQTYYENEGNDGNIGLFLRNEGTEPYEINAGDRIGQLMFIPYLIPDDDNPLQGKRTGGFGSTGK